jgi:hypothetical protein
MTKHELQERMKGNPEINNTDYAVLEKLYLLLDLDKDHFAKICDVVGVANLVVREPYWDRLQAADDERQARLKYEEAQRKLATLDEERQFLIAVIDSYKGAKL